MDIHTTGTTTTASLQTTRVFFFSPFGLDEGRERKGGNRTCVVFIRPCAHKKTPQQTVVENKKHFFFSFLKENAAGKEDSEIEKMVADGYAPAINTGEKELETSVA